MAILQILVLILAVLSESYAQEKQILLDIRTSLKDPTNVFNNWDESSASPCKWNGITCDSNGSVTEISLESKWLSGQLPSTICGLKSLKKVQLGHNSLYGNIPNGLWNNCSKLETLNLTSNTLTGSLPDFSPLGSLQLLDLSKNNFSGKFPTSVTKLSLLYSLSLGDNPLDQGLIPNEIYSLKSLNWLYLSNCGLKGPISPSIGNLTELVNLELSDNYLTGIIPKEITKLTKLYQLELYNNYLTGEIPSGFGNLTNLKNFDASTNSLLGTLSELASLKNLVSLQLYQNHLSGQIPNEFGELQFLINLSLYRNNLIGPLPQKLGSLSDFTTIDVSENRLTGLLPPDMCKRGKLKFLLVLQNFLTGEIPESYGSCSTLVRFRVNNNSLNGEIPSGIWGLPQASIIDLSLNYFVGPVTPDIRNAKSLSVFSIQNNRFSGTLPSEIGQASLLTKMDASNNQLSGELPNELGDLGMLNSLYLRQNMFSGTIPDKLGLCESLSDINLAVNRLNGPIPESLGSIPVLNSLNLSNNELNGQIPDSLSSLKLSSLDFSNNQLTGPVPIQLMNLANNGSFSGNIGLCGGGNSDLLKPCPSHDIRRKSHETHLIAGFIAATAAMILIIGLFMYKKLYQKSADSPENLSWDLKSFHRLSISEHDILNSLKEENVIGHGGSGKVYRGELSNGETIAVKRLWTNNSSKLYHTKQSLECHEFEMEVETLGTIRHRNIVKLYCCISSRDSNLLVYEYMHNGSLWDRLHETKDPNLNWHRRYKIALGAAHGLAYLHRDCVPAIIHRDVKSSNILLDEDYEPRIADFGIAKILQARGRGDSVSIIAGTHGYIAPEYVYTSRVTEKSDVYSFGVVLMELVTGKRPIEPEFGENKNIVHWISHKIATKESAYEVIDSTISQHYEEEMIKVLKIAVHSTSNLPALRPSMREVVQMLLEADPCLSSFSLGQKANAQIAADIKKY
eukprot:Gb_35288 [translate_table: standard]